MAGRVGDRGERAAPGVEDDIVGVEEVAEAADVIAGQTGEVKAIIVEGGVYLGNPGNGCGGQGQGVGGGRDGDGFVGSRAHFINPIGVEDAVDVGGRIECDGVEIALDDGVLVSGASGAGREDAGAQGPGEGHGIGEAKLVTMLCRVKDLRSKRWRAAAV